MCHAGITGELPERSYLLLGAGKAPLDNSGVRAGDTEITNRDPEETSPRYNIVQLGVLIGDYVENRP